MQIIITLFPLKHVKLRTAEKLDKECSSAFTVSDIAAADYVFGASNVDLN